MPSAHAIAPHRTRASPPRMRRLLPMDRLSRWSSLILLCLGVLITAGIAILSQTALSVLSGVRAYVGGESLWSKGQKDAVHWLHRYAATGDPKALAAYRAAIAVPLGDRIGREELEKAHPDEAVARRGIPPGAQSPGRRGRDDLAVPGLPVGRRFPEGARHLEAGRRGDRPARRRRRPARPGDAARCSAGGAGADPGGHRGRQRPGDAARGPLLVHAGGGGARGARARVAVHRRRRDAAVRPRGAHRAPALPPGHLLRGALPERDRDGDGRHPGGRPPRPRAVRQRGGIADLRLSGVADRGPQRDGARARASARPGGGPPARRAARGAAGARDGSPGVRAPRGWAGDSPGGLPGREPGSWPARRHGRPPRHHPEAAGRERDRAARLRGPADPPSQSRAVP